MTKENALWFPEPFLSYHRFPMRTLLLSLSLVLVAGCADLTQARADYVQSQRYAQGVGVQADAGKAFEYLKKSADGGFSLAQMKIGYMYLLGTGAEKNPETAFYYFKRAAENGSVDGQYNTGLAYVRGEGTEKDLSQAAEWFEKAAYQGDAGAQFNLGLMYFNGDGVTKDSLAASVWLRLSSEQGYEGAKGAMSLNMNNIGADQMQALDDLYEVTTKSIKKPAPVQEPTL
jgi:TPR repeat protein